MADDEKKLADGEAEESAESKDWQWDASAPLTNEDYLNDIIPKENPADEADDEDAQETAEEIADEEDGGDDAEQDEDETGDSDDGEDGKPENGSTPDGCCIICGQKIRNSKSELYCNECRSKYMKVDFGATHIILSIVMVFVAVIGIVAFVSTAKITDGIKKADKLSEEGKYSAASDTYDEVYTTVDELNNRFNAFIQGISRNAESTNFYDGGKSVGQKQAVLTAKTFSLAYDDPDQFFSLVDSSFTEKELNSKKYAEVKEFRDALSNFYEDYKKMNSELEMTYSPLFEAAYNGESKEKINETKVKVLADIDKYLKSNPDISECAAAYFNYTLLYFSAQNYGVEIDTDELYEYASKAYAAGGKFNYIFFQDIAANGLTVEKYDDVIAAADKVLKTNPSNADAYYYKAVTLVRLQKFDEAIKVCDEIPKYAPDDYDYCSVKATALRRTKEYAAAIDVCESVPADAKSSEVLRQEAIAYYLAGDEENALKYAKESYDSAYAASYNNGTFSLEAVNTCALIYKLCGDEASYDEILTSLKDSNAELEDCVKEVIKGDKTFEDLFMTGKGDII